MTIEALSQSRWCEARWLVIAPHADDETLGTGALIATQAAAGQLAAVLFLTDGAASHTHEDLASRDRLVAMRREEAEAAISVLCGVRLPERIFLAWPDAETEAMDAAVVTRDVDRLRRLCERLGVTAIAVTALHEPHCDHASAARLARRLAAAMTPPPDLFEYLVWADAPSPLTRRAVRTDPVCRELRSRALERHRSQLTDRAGEGFRLEAARRVMPATDILYLAEPPHAF